jgi:hypothetical protein
MNCYVVECEWVRQVKLVEDDRKEEVVSETDAPKAVSKVNSHPSRIEDALKREFGAETEIEDVGQHFCSSFVKGAQCKVQCHFFKKGLICLNHLGIHM